VRPGAHVYRERPSVRIARQKTPKIYSPRGRAGYGLPAPQVIYARHGAMVRTPVAELPKSGWDRLIPLLPGMVASAPALVVAVMSGDERLLVPALGGLMHFLAALALPKVARLRRPLLRPANFTYAVFSLQLLILPWLTVLVPYQRPGFAAPPLDLERQALFLVGLAFFGTLAGQRLQARGAVETGDSTKTLRFASKADGSTFLGWTFIAIGLLGLAMYFQDLESLFSYYRGNFVVNEAFANDSVVEGVSTFLRPFLSVGLVLLWVRGRTAAQLKVRDVVFAVLVVLSGSSYSYNRGQLVATTLATIALLLALSSYRPRRLTAVLGLLLVVGGTFQIGQMREQNNLRAVDQALNSSSPVERLPQDLQLYGNGPQFAGFMLQIRANDPLLLGGSIYSSLISPVPVLGKSARSDSGTALYNRAIYGTQPTQDQIPLATIESYWNGGIPAVLAFGLLLGMANGWLDRVFLHSDRLVPRFGAAYYGYWTGLAVMTSFAVIAQLLIYFSAPFLLLIVLHKLRAPALEQVARA
jgi:hypothetical protein